MKTITLKVLKNTDFSRLYTKLLVGDELSENQRKALLQIAVILISAGAENAQDLGYRIVVFYCNYYADYEPLYDIGLAKGYIPVAKSIERRPEFGSMFGEHFYSTFLSSFGETYRFEKKYLTSQQWNLNEFFFANVDAGVAVVAPTSYGKSELFVQFCDKHSDATICIIVPTKALLAQMKRRVLHGVSSLQRRKIITHPEMYNSGDTHFIAILTQERLLRIVQNDRNLKFDYIFVDEAHNLFYGDHRNLLLAKVIAITKRRNDHTRFNFLTPFLNDANNLRTKYTELEFAQFKISENLKTERYYAIDFRKGYDNTLKFYDQYINEFIDIDKNKYEDEIDFVIRKSKKKNIVYLNSPPKLERLSASLTDSLQVSNDPALEEACRDIAELLHREYRLLDSLRRGVIYHHGSVPDIVRLYIEHLYATMGSVRYVVSNSTLLEGVNIPAERLFMMECAKGRSYLTTSQFKNLVGRICRFSELFDHDSGSLEMLEPSVYIVGSEYIRADANIEKFLKDRVKADKKITDKLENVLLNETVITEQNNGEMERAEEMLENLQPGITGKEVVYAQTNVGRFCFQNNITEFNIIENEEAIQQLLDQNVKKGIQIGDTETLLEIVDKAFIRFVPEDKHRELVRLKEDSAKRFYKMFIGWRMRNASYNEMIRSFLEYWGRVDDPLIYVDKWGDTRREDSYRESWVDISKKTNKQRVNLAIVRIKEEQEFVDNRIMKFVEVLNDLEILQEVFYMKIKYGTTDASKVTMMKNGFSGSLASLLLEKYLGSLNIDSEANTVDLDEDVLDLMRANGENRILIFETGFNTRT